MMPMVWLLYGAGVCGIAIGFALNGSQGFAAMAIVLGMFGAAWGVGRV